MAIHHRETLGLVGESGSGKSTLGRTILGLAPLTAGSIRFEGRELGRLSPKAWRGCRRSLQIVFQDPFASLNPRMTVEQIVGEPLRNFNIARGPELRRRVLALIDRVGLRQAHADRYPHEFSGGQRQRIGIARALAPEPSLIICDEPVSALDVSVQAQIVNLLRDLQEERGVSLLFIAHDLAVVENISQRVAVMYLGRVMEVGPRKAIFGGAAHPYTQALLSAVPAPDPGASRNRVILSGDIPSASAPPSGCRFRTRCVHAHARCAREEPVLRELHPDHWSACHLHDDSRTGDIAAVRVPIDEAQPLS
ncbi:oligopeptide/dipeptide ABC transporter ATP-binding protein [Castellaniella sp. GW247-6E4]|uniref:ABC transporter ATP-binding protein n=1 Tax=Castellaniella sp. GW247-6E4 TaxID=3140380 RepID=UPI003314EE0A